MAAYCIEVSAYSQVERNRWAGGEDLGLGHSAALGGLPLVSVVEKGVLCLLGLLYYVYCTVWQGEWSFLEAAWKVTPAPPLVQQLLGAVRRGYYISSGNSAKNERKSTICGLLGEEEWGWWGGR